MRESPHQALIESLGAALVPVRRLAPPWLRTAGWLLLLAAIAAALLAHFGAGLLLARWSAAPDQAWADAGAALTAVCAAASAFILAVPGRRAAWAWLPLPGLLLWIGASGLGCLRTLLTPGGSLAGAPQSSDCLVFIVGLSIPLSALLVWLLRRACPLRPVRVAVLAGLACAGASAALLGIFHGHDATATDLLAHALAVAVVVGANALLGGRLLAPR